MRTQFRAEQLRDPHLKEAEHALRTCVHCGFCTASCPTYLTLGDERDSPRGRIVLIQHMLESTEAPTAETVKHLDRCLSCLGCKSACPSGVDYSALIDTARIHIEKHHRRPWTKRAYRSLLLRLLTRPRLFGFLSGLARVFAPIGKALPGKAGALARKALRAPARRVPSVPMPPVPEDAPRVALLKGCVQQAMAPGIDEASRRVLARRGMRASPMDDAGCCGALAYHLGKEADGKDHARRVIRAFETAAAKGADSLLVTATGCTSFLKDYGRVFAGDTEWEPRARAVAAKAKDFTELVAPAPQPSGSGAVAGLKLAFHPPCSLQHAQRIHGRGEALLKAAGFQLAPIPDAHLCCGSAGSYSLLQPQIAEDLRTRKLAAIRSTGAAAIASANLGCLAHLSGEMPALHIAELLDWAEGGPKPL